MPPSLPEITMELNSGSLTIKTAEAIYHVLVSGADSVAPAPAPKPSQPALMEKPPSNIDEGIQRAEGAPEDEEYYRELSQDMYKEVGKLARRLSMSIRDVTIDKIDSIDLNNASDQLESAKDELEAVVKMTEKATF